jgi:hypothetical protein
VIAREVERLASEFLRWLDLPPEQRWDNYVQQSLEAALFSRYQLSIKVYDGPPVEVSLFELRWPPGSEVIVHALKRMRTLLGVPLAVFHAAQQALLAEKLPTEDEVTWAHQSLQGASEELRVIIRCLQAELIATLAADSWHTVPA